MQNSVDMLTSVGLKVLAAIGLWGKRYGPTKPYFDRSWVPPGIEQVK